MKQIKSNIVKMLIERIQLEGGLSVGQFAQRIGMTPEGIYRILDGRTKLVRISTVKQICGIFKYQLEIEGINFRFHKLYEDDSSPPTAADGEKTLRVWSKYAKDFGYEPTAEGLDMFFKDYEGQHLKFKQIRDIISEKKIVGGLQTFKDQT